MKKLSVICSALLSVLAVALATPGVALQHPLKLANDGRIEVVPFETNNVVPVYGTPFTSTQIIFGVSQIIVSVQGGDAGGWSPYIDKNVPNVLNLKLAAAQSNANMTVITESTVTHKRYYYYFHLMSVSKDNQSDATYAIRFLYPAQQAARLTQSLIDRLHRKHAEVAAFEHPKDYHWDYSFDGDTSIMPLHVFDDGKFTYFEFRPNTPLPAIFAVDNTKGQESIVNFRQDGNFVVVQRTAPQFTLREGKDHVVSVFNNPAIARLRAAQDD